MKTLRHFPILSIAGSLLALPGLLPAASFNQAEITQIYHEVKTLERSGARPAQLNETIGGEQSVKTGQQSRAELMFSDKSLTRLGADTIFSFQQGTRELELKQGTILFQVPKGAGGAKIRTAAITAAITGTTGFYEYAPKAGANGIIKFGILEGEATLFIKGRLGHFIRVGPGEMVIVTARPDDFNATDVVHYDIFRFLQTAPLITKMGGLPNSAKGLVDREVSFQTRKFTTSKELFRTNIVIPGSGTEAFLLTQRDIDQRLVADNPLTATPPVQIVAPPSKFGPLKTITSPNPYVIKNGTRINTDPLITTDGKTDYGKIYRGQAVDGAPTDYLFGSTSTLEAGIKNDAGVSPFLTPLFPKAGTAVFRFSNLVLAGAPTFVTSQGPNDLMLVAEGTITSAAPGGIINFGSLRSLSLATVDGSIRLGPELAFVGSDLTMQQALGVYARGAASDLFFDSSVNLPGGGVGLIAGRDLEVGGAITAKEVTLINVGNTLTLNGIITAEKFIGNTHGNFAGGSGGLIKAPSVELRSGDPFFGTLTNTLVLSQTPGRLLVNSLAIDPAPLLNLKLLAPFIQVPTTFSTGSVTLLELDGIVSGNSISAGSILLRGLTGLTGTLSATNDINVTGPITAGVISAGANLDINGNVAVTGGMSSGGDLFVNGVTGVMNNLTSLGAIDLQGNATIGGSVSSGSDLNVVGDLTVALDVTSGGSVDVTGNATVGGNVTAANQISVSQNATIGGNVSSTSGITLTGTSTIVGTINAGFLSGGSITAGGNVTVANILSVSSLTLPNPAASLVVNGGIVSNNSGNNGGTSTITAASIQTNFISFAGVFQNSPTDPPPGNGGSLTLNSSSLLFGAGGIDNGAFVYGGDTNVPGAAGGNGGTFTANTTGPITVNTSIDASSGRNTADASVIGGAGGTVNLTSTANAVTVNGTIDVSSNESGPGNSRQSAKGGNIKLQSGRLAGTAINVTNSAQLRALLNAAAPGPGGSVILASAGGDINVAGSIQADRGLIDIRNAGPLGIINLQDGHNINADVVKVGALGNNGVLNIGNGNINANTLLKLYAGGTNGTINFVSNANLSGGAKIIAAKTVNVSNGVNVGISGSAATFFTDNPNYNGAGKVKAGFGTVTGPGATLPHAGRPAFDP